MLAAGNDLATVADCMGHASTDTTPNHYDRRGEAAKAAAMSTIPVPCAARPHRDPGATSWVDAEPIGAIRAGIGRLTRSVQVRGPLPPGFGSEGPKRG